MNIILLHDPLSAASRDFLAGLGVTIPDGDDVTVTVGEDTVRIISDHGTAVGVCPAFPGYPTVLMSEGEGQRILAFPADWIAAREWANNPPAETGTATPMSFEAFIRRFTEVELEAATALGRTDVKVDIFWKRVMAAASSGIDLTYQPVIDGVNYLVGKIDGFDQARANAVLGVAA